MMTLMTLKNMLYLPEKHADADDAKKHRLSTRQT
jgi:hypothetical protein